MKKDLKHFGNKERRIAMIDKLIKIVIKAYTIVSFIGIILCILTSGGYIPPICAMTVVSIAWFLVLFSFLLIFLSNRKKKPESATSEKEIRLISVKEALPPDESTKVICMMKSNGEFVSGYIYLNNGVPTIETNPAFEFEDYGNYEVTHWMYIPEIKKG